MDEQILTNDAIQFLTQLERQIGTKRIQLLQNRKNKNNRFVFPENNHAIRNSEWSIDPIPTPLQKRWVEITGPTDRKMVINALNSGANIFMADFEDANCPTWTNMIEGQINLRDAVNETISYTNPHNGKAYTLAANPATLLVRPRGWHLEEKNLQIDGQPISASLFDFGLYFFHNAHTLIEKGAGPYFYLPKLESFQEATLWNETFLLAQQLLELPIGTIKATVLIETIPAAFCMEEILYVLRHHIVGLNAGRWDYIFSAIKEFPQTLFPDRAQIGMTAPFMHAYTEQMIHLCHKRKAHAIGGMAAFIPSRHDPKLNELALTKIRTDKEREARAGCDGSWVAHPDLVPIVRDIFATHLKGADHQKEKRRLDVSLIPEPLIEFTIPQGHISEKGLRININVAILYLNAWLQGEGAVALFNMMEDTATAEISRAQIWQWIHHPDAYLTDGRPVTSALYQQLKKEELISIQQQFLSAKQKNRLTDAIQLLDQLVLSESFSPYLTIEGAAYL